MTDPWDDRLRHALSAEAERFSPAAPLAATRVSMVGRVRRRQRQVMALGAAAIVVLVATAALAGIGRPSDSSSRQVAAQGGTHGGTGPATSAVTPGPPGSVGAVPNPPGGVGTIPSSATVPGATPGTTVTPPIAATTVVPPTSAPATTVTSTATSVAPAASAVRGTVAFSPVCPVEKVPPDPACAPRPGAARITLLRPDGSVAAQGAAGADGHFALPVGPGDYTVQAVPVAASATTGRPCVVTPSSVVVTPGNVSTVTVACDTGIR